jgi:hypothetical protein
MVPFSQNGHSQILEGCNTTITTRIDQFYSGPVVVDSYWTESRSSLGNPAESAASVEREVGPGEGRATLAVVLVNRNSVDVSAAVVLLKIRNKFCR